MFAPAKPAPRRYSQHRADRIWRGGPLNSPPHIKANIKEGGCLQTFRIREAKMKFQGTAMTTDSPQAAQAEALDFPADPLTHGLEPGDIGHIQTHISEVFLAGDLVYKVKRAVRYSFVDFSSLESRHAACETELALNRRTAPDIYIGIVAVRRARNGRLVLDHPKHPCQGDPIEWAVVMRRFDESMAFDRLAERGDLRPRWILELVDAVVALHEGAEVEGTPYGGFEGLTRILTENATDMTNLPEVFAPVEVKTLTAATRASLSANAAFLDVRRQAVAWCGAATVTSTWEM